MPVQTSRYYMKIDSAIRKSKRSPISYFSPLFFRLLKVPNSTFENKHGKRAIYEFFLN